MGWILIRIQKFFLWHKSLSSSPIRGWVKFCTFSKNKGLLEFLEKGSRVTSPFSSPAPGTIPVTEQRLDRYLFNELINDGMIELNPCLKWSWFIVMLWEGNKKERGQGSASLNATCGALSLFLKYFRELCGNLSNPPCQEESEDRVSASLRNLSMCWFQVAREVKLKQSIALLNKHFMFPWKPLTRASVSEEKMLKHQNHERDIKFLSAYSPVDSTVCSQTLQSSQFFNMTLSLTEKLQVLEDLSALQQTSASRLEGNWITDERSLRDESICYGSLDMREYIWKICLLDFRMN